MRVTRSVDTSKLAACRPAQGSDSGRRKAVGVNVCIGAKYWSGWGGECIGEDDWEGESVFVLTT